MAFVRSPEREPSSETMLSSESMIDRSSSSCEAMSAATVDTLEMSSETTGPRAAMAASVLQAAGLNARPVLDGGVATWHGETCSFRRCGT